MGSILFTLASFLSAAFSLATFVLFARIILSWLRPDPPVGFVRTIVRAIYDVTDPVLDWLRVKFPFLIVGGFDLSPLVAFVGLGLLRSLVVGGLQQWALALGA